MVPQVIHLKVIGLASQKTILEIEVHPVNEQKTLLELLQEYKIPIASSCLGAGQCQKCIVAVNDRPRLSCTILMKSLESQCSVGISYL